MSKTEGSALPLAGLRCLVCGVDNCKPVELAIQQLGGHTHNMTRTSQALPDVVVADNAKSKRLQVRTGLLLCARGTAALEYLLSSCSKRQRWLTTRGRDALRGVFLQSADR